MERLHFSLCQPPPSQSVQNSTPTSTFWWMNKNETFIVDKSVPSKPLTKFKEASSLLIHVVSCNQQKQQSTTSKTQRRNGEERRTQVRKEAQQKHKTSIQTLTTQQKTTTASTTAIDIANVDNKDNSRNTTNKQARGNQDLASKQASMHANKQASMHASKQADNKDHMPQNKFTTRATHKD